MNFIERPKGVSPDEKGNKMTDIKLPALLVLGVLVSLTACGASDIGTAADAREEESLFLFRHRDRDSHRGYQ